MVLVEEDPDLILEDFLVAFGLITDFLFLGLKGFVVLEGSIHGIITSGSTIRRGVSFRGNGFSLIFSTAVYGGGEFERATGVESFSGMG